jgi:exoribonuclease-2
MTVGNETDQREDHPMTHRPHHHRSDLLRIANLAMIERGLEPEFSAAALRQAATLSGAAHAVGPQIADLTALPWCSLDNDDSMDLDQLTVAQALPGSVVKISVAVADVDALVQSGSAIDAHAQINTTAVYTSARVFPLLPERLCFDLTSLNPGQDRLAMVTEMHITPDGEVASFKVHRALVRNQAKLAYDAVSAWIDHQGPLPEAAAAVPAIAGQLQLQDEVAQRLRLRRHEQGSLEFQTFQPRAVFEQEQVVDILQQVQNRGRQLIEEFMIAANGCNAQLLAQSGVPSLRRVVRSPERWQRIVNEARKYGEALPNSPDSQALEGFLAKRRRADPLRFPDLSLVIVKLMGSGEYVVEKPGESPIGHFGLAVRNYTHSTAPNRRYPDLITSRLLKAALAHRPSPYSVAELRSLADHCTAQEDAARKVERRLRKSEAALLLENRLGQRFDAIVTGQSEHDTWVRIFTPPVEGKLVDQRHPLAVGQKLRVKLIATDVERGFIDFVAVS